MKKFNITTNNGKSMTIYAHYMKIKNNAALFYNENSMGSDYITSAFNMNFVKSIT